MPKKVICVSTSKHILPQMNPRVHQGAPIGTTWVPLEPLLGVLGRSCVPFWAPVGLSWDAWVRFEPLLGVFGRSCVPFWAPVALSWASWDPFAYLLGVLGRSRVPFWVPVGLAWVPLARPWARHLCFIFTPIIRRHYLVQGGRRAGRSPLN